MLFDVFGSLLISPSSSAQAGLVVDDLPCYTRGQLGSFIFTSRLYTKQKLRSNKTRGGGALCARKARARVTFPLSWCIENEQTDYQLFLLFVFFKKGKKERKKERERKKEKKKRLKKRKEKERKKKKRNLLLDRADCGLLQTLPPL